MQEFRAQSEEDLLTVVARNSLEIKFTEGVSAGLAADYALITGMPGRAVAFGHKAYNIKCLHYSSVISVNLRDSSGIQAAFKHIARFSLQSLTSHCIAGRKERFLALIATLWSEGRQRCQKWSPLTLQLQCFADNLLHEGNCSSLCRDFVKSVMQWNFYPCSAAEISLKRAILVWNIIQREQ